MRPVSRQSVTWLESLASVPVPPLFKQINLQIALVFPPTESLQATPSALFLCPLSEFKPLFPISRTSSTVPACPRLLHLKPPIVSGLGSWHQVPPPLPPLSTQSSSHSPRPPWEQGFPTSDTPESTPTPGEHPNISESTQHL